MTIASNAVPSVDLVIVAWNSSDVIAACLRSIERQEYSGHIRTIIWDNASTDDTVRVARSASDTTTVVSSAVNLGFGKGNNRAAALGDGEYIFFLNPDTVLVGTSVVASLVERLEQFANVGIVAPRLTNQDGSLQGSVSPFPALRTLLPVAVGFHRLLPDDLHGRLSLTTWSMSTPRYVDWVKGAALALRRRDFDRYGGWSESTFMYGEDMALCFAARRAGARVLFDPSIGVLHLDDHSSRQRWSDTERAAIIARGEMTFMYDNYGRCRADSLRALLLCAYASRALVLRVLNHRTRASVYSAMARAYVLGRAA
jgi:GT2 family glycosyltransferase